MISIPPIVWVPVLLVIVPSTLTYLRTKYGSWKKVLSELFGF